MRLAPSKPRRGFTLMELLVVMTILVILVLIALPVFNYVTGARSTESGLNMAAAMVSRARALALSRPDNKYIGVLFYYEPDSDRDAMQIVAVEAGDSASALERYFGWQGQPLGGTLPFAAPTYQEINTNVTDPRPPDAVYSVSIDPLTGLGPTIQDRPVVHRYVCKRTNTNSRPPGGNTTPLFTNGDWAFTDIGNTIPVSLDAEVQYMPRGVRTRVLKLLNPPNPKISPVSLENGRACGMILFDKQGRRIERKWGIAASNKGGAVANDGGEKLLEAMGINTDLPYGPDNRKSGVALAVFNDADVIGDPKDFDVVNKWVVDVDGGANQYTVGSQSGELISGPAQ